MGIPLKNKREMLVKTFDYALIFLGRVMLYNLPHNIYSDGLAWTLRCLDKTICPSAWQMITN